MRKTGGNKTKRKAVDLFCGCGGLSLGLRRAGFAVIGAVDIDPLANQTYKTNHKTVLLWESDIRDLSPGEMLAALGLKKGEIDLLAGCPPCQGFSSIRTRNGSLQIDDPRNDLLFDFLRFVEGMRPMTVMMENVPGLAEDGRFFRFLSEMERLGYKGDHQILNAADYNVPQRRRRLIYLAGKGFVIQFAEGMNERKTVRDAISGLPKAGRSGDPVHDIHERRTERVKEIIRRIPKNGGSRQDLPQQYQLNCHKRCNGFKDVYGRMSWDDVAPTITSGCFNPSKGRFLHPVEDRAITMREAALLQGFPLDYRFPTNNSKTAIALMIGNALPPPFIEAHARMVLESLLR